MKEKKHVLFAFLLFCNISFAQFYMGIGAGIGGSTVPKSKWNVDAKGAVSAGYLFYAKDDTAKMYGFLLELGVEYANRGLLLPELNKNSRSYIEMTSRAHYIKIPVVFGVEGLFANSKSRYNVFLGFYYSRGLKSSGTLSGFAANKDITANLNDIFKEKTLTGYEYKPITSNNVGVRAGVAFYFPFNLFLKLNLDADFIKMQKHLSKPACYADITLGYRLKFKK